MKKRGEIPSPSAVLNNYSSIGPPPDFLTALGRPAQARLLAADGLLEHAGARKFTDACLVVTQNRLKNILVVAADRGGRPRAFSLRAR